MWLLFGSINKNEINYNYFDSSFNSVTFVFCGNRLAVRYAYDRTCPELPKFISQGVMGKRVKTKKGKSVSRQRAEELREKANIKYEMTTFDDVKLVAHYYPAENAKRVIICCHGWHSSWDYDFNGPADFLHDSGSSLLLVELRAHGESGGRYVYYGKKERYDIALWSNFVAKNINDKFPIYIYGMSIGAMSSIMSTASGLNKNVVGIIADSAPSDARNLGHTVISNLHINPKFIYPVIRLDSKIRIKMDIQHLMH